MDGQSLCRDVRRLLLESDTSDFVDDRLTLDMLWEAAIHLNGELRWLTDEYPILTVANSTNYNLPADFQELYVVDTMNQYVVRAWDGTSDTFVKFRDFDKIYYSRLPTNTPQSIPNFFSLVDATPITRVTGSVTSSGASVNGESNLIDSSAPFTNISVGDEVHNITDDSSGLVIGVTSTSTLVTALYDGTTNDWSVSGPDNYMVVPQARMSLVVDPPSLVSGYTIYVPYVKRPAPVYSLYGSYPFPDSFRYALTKYAAWMYKYRDKEPNYGDQWYKYFDENIRKIKRTTNRTRQRTGFKVNYNKYSLTDRSWR